MLAAGHLAVHRVTHAVGHLGAAHGPPVARLELELHRRAVAAHLGGGDGDVGLGNHAPHLALELVEVGAGDGDVGAARHLELDVDLVGLGLRRQLHRDQRPRRQRQTEQHPGRREHPAAVPDRAGEQVGVARLEPAEPREEPRRLPLGVGAHAQEP